MSPFCIKNTRNKGSRGPNDEGIALANDRFSHVFRHTKSQTNALFASKTSSTCPYKANYFIISFRSPTNSTAFCCTWFMYH